MPSAESGLCLAGGELYDGDVGGGSDPHGRSPGTRAASHVQLGVAVAFEPCDRRIGQGRKIVSRPELTAVRMSGQLQVHAVFDGVMDDDGLMCEQHGGARRVPVTEGLGEIGAVALALAGEVVDAGEVEAADLHALVPQRPEPQLADMVDPLLGAREVLVVAGQELTQNIQTLYGGSRTMETMQPTTTEYDGCGKCLVAVRRLSRRNESSNSPGKQLGQVLTAATDVGAHIIGWADDWEVSGATDPLTRPQLGPWLRGEMGPYDGIAGAAVDRIGRAELG